MSVSAFHLQRQTAEVLLVVVLTLRLIACSAVTYFVWRSVGTTGLAVCAPLFGIALARPVIGVIEESVLFGKRLAYRELDGRHYAHRGFSMDITEDSTLGLWIKTADARKVLPGLPCDLVLQRMFPQGLRIVSFPKSLRGAVRMNVDALVTYLDKSTDASSLKFRLWLRREVLFPANVRKTRSQPVSAVTQ